MSRPRAWSLRTVAAVAVAVLHGILVQVLILSAAVRAAYPAKNVLQVRLIPPDQTRLLKPPPEPAPPQVPAPSPMPPPVAARDSPAPVTSFMAVTSPSRGEAGVEPNAPVDVVEAMDFDTDTLRERCVRAYPDAAPDLEVDGTLTLMVRVEPNGRPSETKIVVSSGSSPLDEAVGACFLSLGTFEPVTVDGQGVRSWQRVMWRRRRAP